MPTVEAFQQELTIAFAASLKPGYVYTYPPKRAFRPLNGHFSYEQAWKNWKQGVNLYIHVPFCEVRCRFCNLFTIPLKSTNRSLTDAYVDALITEIQSYEPLLGTCPVESIYFGGGTPTFLTAAQFERIFRQLYSSFSIAEGINTNVEMYPEDVKDTQKLEALKSLGVNRISFGIQTFDPEELRKTGRPYPAELSQQALSQVTQMGFSDVNADLIYGLPEQTLESWKRNLHIIGQLQPTTVTLYPLMIRPVTTFNRQKEQGKATFVPDQTKFEWYEISKSILHDYGYHQETTVRFVIPGKGGYLQQDREFSGTPTLGLGPGARTSAPDAHYSTNYAVAYGPTLEIIQAYIAAMEERKPAASEGFLLDEDEKRRRYVIQALQVSQGVNPTRFIELFGSSLTDLFGAQFEALRREGCIQETESGSIILTEKGRKYSDSCVRILFSERVKQLEQEYQHV